jgi:flavin reductase (DIM6/NTAB) family NADH-FMN oxidoreductase RutF
MQLMLRQHACSVLDYALSYNDNYRNFLNFARPEALTCKYGKRSTMLNFAGNIRHALGMTTGGARMEQLELSKAFTLIESGPVVLVTTHDGKKDNIMTISWTMVMDFTPVFAITTGQWNHSFAALCKNRECVIAIPTIDLLDKVIGIGTCSGADTDKFARFKLTPVPARLVRPPLIRECLANIECKVIDIVKKHNIVVLEGVAAYLDSACKERRTVHAVGDGTFIVDGRKIDRKKMMASKLPSGI